MSKKPAAKASPSKTNGKAVAASKPAPVKPALGKPAKAAHAALAKPSAGKQLTAKSLPAKAAGVKAAVSKSALAAKPAAKKPASQIVVPPPKIAAKEAPKQPPARTLATTKVSALKKTEGLSKKMAARAKTSDIVLPPGYRPSDDEPFMNELHRAYFRKRLLEWKEDILRQTRETLAILHEDSTQHADLADRATSETDRATELRTRDRLRKLISKIDAALGRIEDGSYGYCEDTGEPIGLKRLDARPIATLSVEAQERHERREKVYREE